MSKLGCRFGGPAGCRAPMLYRVFLRKHQALLQKIEAQYGVDRHVIVAIAGLETSYGGYMGRYATFATLATLAFDHPRRKTFFRKELANYLRLTHQYQLQPLVIKGSAAGAVGMGQFMPSSYLSYGVDGDGDGVVDLFSNVSDSLTSIANYLQVHGWREGVAVMHHISKRVQPSWVSKQPYKKGGTIKLWQGRGLVLDKPQDSGLYRVYRYTTHNEPEYILASDNFYAITRYNHSLWYARAVAELAIQLRQ